MSQFSRLDCSSSSTDLKSIEDGENCKLVEQPSYHCKVCPKSFNKRQAFKNHRFMHLKKERKKLKHSSKAKFSEDSTVSAKNILPKATNFEVTCNGNFDKKVYLTSSNNALENDEEIKVPNKMPSAPYQPSNVAKDSKLKCENKNLAVTLTNSPLHPSNSGVLSASYTCPFCDKVFSFRKTYLNHKKNHRKKINAALKITQSNFEQVIIDFIRSIRLATETTKSSANQASNTLKCDNSSFDLRTVINNASLNNEKDCVSYFHAIPSKNQTPQKCDLKPFDQLKDFNTIKRLNSTPFFKQKCAKRIPLNQNIVPYEC